jgi:hypothetical protein
MSDDKPYFATHGLKIPPRVPQPGERLFTFERDQTRYRCELRDFGEYGCEAQFFEGDEFIIGLRFEDLNAGDSIVTARELATAWAYAQRKAIETAP